MKAVSYDDAPIPPPVAPLGRTAVVTAKQGRTVNLRSRPDKTGAMISRVPLGREVDLLEETNSEWWKIRWDNEVGYMMREFLRKVCP